MKKALLVPIYQPESGILPYLKQFKEGDFDYFLVVDDGSGEKYQDRFEEVKKKTLFAVLSYPNNRGKGGALKAGIARLLEIDPGIDYIFTCDGDGQHAYEDVIALSSHAEEENGCLLLGVRSFDDESIPLRSRVGNAMSRVYIRLMTGMGLKDSQTGLRGIPSCLFPLALESYGMRYDYEMNFLLASAKTAPIYQMDIQTIYENNNETSHFNPVKDTVRIYKSLLLFLLISLVSWIVDLGCFYLFSTYVFTASPEQMVFLSALVARTISGTIHFIATNILVFHTKKRLGWRILGYAISWSINLFLSSWLTYFLSNAHIVLTLGKALMDLAVALLDYIANLTVQFFRRKGMAKRRNKAA